MYTLTFYSFKGGVGRSMALVNVGVELCKNSRKVLLVDFDLEAPGLETFNILKPKENNAGIIDYLDYYLDNGVAPDVMNYIYQPQDFNNLWVMPAGKRDNDYGNKFNKINWNDLYENKDGYVMFEDLKAQWEKNINPDYVLIDSRTGHTDIGGICTRQLPDSVVVFYFPNEQNLKGLETVINDIRKEGYGARKKKIKIHFVTSNVPDLDDEDQILESRMKQFKSKLHFLEPTITIHHYNSLSLLNQTVFTMERPKSRLAQEYKHLIKQIVRYNDEDKDGVIDYLKTIQYMVDPIEFIDEGAKIIRREFKKKTESAKDALEDRFEKIKKHNKNHGEILYRLGSIRENQGNIRDAADLYKESLKSGYDLQHVLMKLIEMHANEEGIDYTKYIEELLKKKELSSQIFNRLLVHLDEQQVESILDKAFYKKLGLEGRFEYAKKLIGLKKYNNVNKVIDDIIISRKDIYFVGDVLKTEITIMLIRYGKYNEVMDILTSGKYDWSLLINPALFNYAMADWAKECLPNKEIFQKVIEIESVANMEVVVPNYCQCMALASAICGDIEKFNHYYLLAKDKLEAIGLIEHFSSWRYLMVDTKTFQRDLEAIKKLAYGKNIKPLFMRNPKKME